MSGTIVSRSANARKGPRQPPASFAPALFSSRGNRRAGGRRWNRLLDKLEAQLRISGYANDDFGYLPTAKVLAEGGYETRGLIPDPGFFSPEVEGVVLAKVRELAEKAGRALPE